MHRGRTGRIEESRFAGEAVRAFVPAALPPAPPLDLSGELQRQLEHAHLALGRLDSVSTLLPSPELFLYSYVRKEALLSSQIEGTQSSLSDLFLFEMDYPAGARIDDVTEVANYVAAMQHGLERLRGGFPLCNRLIREIHQKLLSRGRGSDKRPGEFRTSQNWLGGTRPGTAAFVPPPPDLVPECMGELERFLHDDADELPWLVRAGLAHVQFETVHPFLDGNGRVGRLLVTFMLCHARVLREPMLYLSLYFKQHRAEYYRLLDLVRDTGDWEAWLSFFCTGVAETAGSAVDTAQRLLALFGHDRGRVQQEGRKANSALRVHESLQARPLASLPDVAKATGLTFPAAQSGMKVLEALGIVDEITNKQRNRVFAYRTYLDILSEGTEPLR